MNQPPKNQHTAEGERSVAAEQIYGAAVTGDGAKVTIFVPPRPVPAPVVSPNMQAGWRWCSRCQVLAYGGEGDGICYDGNPHDLGLSWNYCLILDSAWPKTQADWRWCSRCQVLAYGGEGNGICYDGNPHRLGLSWNYYLMLDCAWPKTQAGWRWCSRCQVLAYGGEGDGICYDGNPHHLSGTGNYYLSY